MAKQVRPVTQPQQPQVQPQAAAARTTPAPTATATAPTVTTRTSAGAAAPQHKGYVTEDAIRIRAYLKWEAAGRPCGNGCNFWLEAERELRAGK